MFHMNFFSFFFNFTAALTQSEVTLSYMYLACLYPAREGLLLVLVSVTCQQAQGHGSWRTPFVLVSDPFFFFLSMRLFKQSLIPCL